MATNTAGTAAREYHTAQIHYLAADVAFGDGNGATITLGNVPAGSYILRGGVVVSEAFNAGTTNTIDVGVTGTATAFASAIALGTVGVIAADDMATTTKSLSAADIAVIATLHMTGTAATTGAGRVWVEYLASHK